MKETYKIADIIIEIDSVTGMYTTTAAATSMTELPISPLPLPKMILNTRGRRHINTLSLKDCL